MGAREKLTLAKVDAIAAKLRELPAREPRARVVSKQETVELLLNEIHALKKRGYTIKEIAQILSAEGASLTAGSLSNFLWRCREAGKPARKGARDATT